MRKGSMLILLLLLSVFCAVGNVSATTIDLLPLFDRDGSGILELGDGFPGGSDLTKDNLGLPTIERSFDLSENPVTVGQFSFFITATGVDFSGNTLTFNGMTFSQLTNGTRTYVGDNSSLNQFGNTALISLAGGSSNYEDFSITRFELSYESSGAYSSSPVPEPATMFLFGVGLLGVAGVSRRKK